jgi:ATP-binding cassette subfamily B protein
VRLARAFLRRGVRLALLDEPFRGLERATRERLLARARARWRTATLVAATHDLADTLAFDRVVVLDGGRIAEQGAPAALAAGDTRYAELLRAERELADEGWGAAGWKRWRVGAGRLDVGDGTGR